MGQKTHPIGLRLGIIKTWNSRWYASDRSFPGLIYEDMMIKRYINRRLDNAGVANVCIARAPKKVSVDIHTSRPGIVIGRKGVEVDKLREELQLLTNKDILLNIVEVRKPELDAKLVADSIARQLEGRVSFRRALKRALAATMKMGAVGVKVQCAGRLGGAEIARTEKYRDGRVPLHTLRADIDYATSTAHTTYGCIGVKVWICRGEILETGSFDRDEDAGKEPEDGAPPARSRRPHGGEKGRRRPRGKVRRKTPAAGGDSRPPKGRRPETRDEGKAQKQAGGGDRGVRAAGVKAKNGIARKTSATRRKRATTDSAAAEKKAKPAPSDSSGEAN